MTADEIREHQQKVLDSFDLLGLKPEKDGKFNNR